MKKRLVKKWHTIATKRAWRKIANLIGMNAGIKRRMLASGKADLVEFANKQFGVSRAQFEQTAMQFANGKTLPAFRRLVIRALQKQRVYP